MNAKAIVHIYLHPYKSASTCFNYVTLKNNHSPEGSRILQNIGKNTASVQEIARLDYRFDMVIMGVALLEAQVHSFRFQKQECSQNLTKMYKKCGRIEGFWTEIVKKKLSAKCSNWCMCPVSKEHGVAC